MCHTRITAEDLHHIGVDIAIQKLRSYETNWSSVDIVANPTLQVHRRDWTPQTVHQGIHNTSKTQLDILSIETQRIAMRIASRRASATVKAMANNMYSLARIRYYGPHLTSSLDDMRKMLDKPIQKLLRKISSNMTSYPTELRYIPKMMAGLGVKCSTDIITASKMAIIHRAQLQSKDAASIAAGMVMRPQRHQQPQWCRFQVG